MKKQHLTLADGKTVRIEANWNVMCEYLDRTGQDYDDFAASADKISTKELRLMAWCCAVEGERLEGRDLGMTEVEFGALVTIHTMAEVGPKFASMVTGEQKKSIVLKDQVKTRPVTNSLKRLFR